MQRQNVKFAFYDIEIPAICSDLALKVVQRSDIVERLICLLSGELPSDLRLFLAVCADWLSRRRRVAPGLPSRRFSRHTSTSCLVWSSRSTQIASGYSRFEDVAIFEVGAPLWMICEPVFDLSVIPRRGMLIDRVSIGHGF